MNKGLDCLALTIVIIGAINWGLIGFFKIDLVAWIFGNLNWVSRVVYDREFCPQRDVAIFARL